MVSKQDILHNLRYLVYPSISSNKLIITFTVILLFALFIDSSLLKIFTFLNSIQHADQQYFTFIYIAFTFVVGQYYILSVVRSRIKENDSTRWLWTKLHKIVTVSGSLLILTFVNHHFRNIPILILQYIFATLNHHS